MDLPLGKLVRDLRTRENGYEGERNEEADVNLRVMGRPRSSSAEPVGRGSCSWRN